jgi:heptosyltransferase-2
VPFQDLLIVRLAALGDVARATAIVARARAEQPHARITWVAGAEAVPLLELVPGLTRIVPVDDRRIFGGRPLEQAAEVVSLWTKLAGRRFDRTILAHPDPRYRRLLWGVRAGEVRVLPTPTRATRQYVADEFAQLLDDSPVDDGRFAVADLRDRVGIVVTDARFLRAADRRPFVLIAPGGARNAVRDDPLRRWPLAQYVSLAEGLLASGHRVALIGAPGDGWVRSAFAGLAVEDFIGELSIPQLLRVMAESDVVVSHDTGPIHLAHLVRARIVALFGPTVPSRVVGAAENVTALWGGAALACRPCYDGKSYAACTRNLCMEDVSVQSVLDAVNARPLQILRRATVA